MKKSEKIAIAHSHIRMVSTSHTITIPKEIIKQIGLSSKTKMNWYILNKSIILEVNHGENFNKNIEEKRCAQCGKLKNVKSFYKHPFNKDGYNGQCKACRRLFYEKNKEEILEHRQQWRDNNRDKYNENMRKYRKNNREKNTEYTKKHRERYPERNEARNAITKAIQRKEIKRPEKCSLCGKKCMPHGHHSDYSKPLEVQWLCRDCHCKIHKKLKKSQKKT